MDAQLTIGQVAARTGVTTSALRFYEDQGLIRSNRTAGNQRRFSRDVIRVVSVIRVAQSLGISLDEIGAVIASLPSERVPTAADWEAVAARWRTRLDERIGKLEALRDDLGGCIGCGCLSLSSCASDNPNDRAGHSGAGARYITGTDNPAPAQP